MKARIRNVLILLFGILALGVIFNTNQVRAEEADSERILNVIPNNIELGISESEYKKSESIILEKIKEILISNEIQCEIIDYNGNGSNYILLKDKTYNGVEARVFVRTGVINFADNIYQYGNVYTGNNEKYVKFKYNKREGYNIEDEKYIKNLELQSPKYYGIDIKKLSSFDSSILENTVKEYYTNLINDSSIVIDVYNGQGGGNYLATGGTFEIGIMKNGILYDVRQIEEGFIPVIKVPDNIDEKGLNEYIIKQIQKYYEDIPTIIEITKGAKWEGMNVTNGYTIYFSSDNIEDCDMIIINKEAENEAIISKVDRNTDIRLETTTAVVPEDTALEIERITEGEKYNTVIATLGNKINKFILYDITLKSNGVKIQPSGKVKISIPVPEGFNKEKLVVYRINEDGTKVKYDIKVETIEGKDYATFEADHFSLYTLAMEETSNGSKELDETPKTGNADITAYTFTAIALISLAGIVVTKKNNK